MITLLEKRLIALSQLGITIQHENGHRWILAMGTDYFDFNKECEIQKVYLCKVYSGINCALDKVDEVLKYTNKISLIDVYNSLVLQYDCESEDYIVSEGENLE